MILLNHLVQLILHLQLVISVPSSATFKHPTILEVLPMPMLCNKNENDSCTDSLKLTILLLLMSYA